MTIGAAFPGRYRVRVRSVTLMIATSRCTALGIWDGRPVEAELVVAP